MNDVMIDNETLGITADAVIMSIGAVKFDLETGEIDDAGFYASISIQSNLDHGRKIDEPTLIWWMNQSKEAQAVFHEPKTTLDTALSDLIDFLDHDRRRVWSNGADFDIPMLSLAYSLMGMTPPWRFYNARCVRTYRAMPAAQNVPKFVPKIAHNALHDAYAQAQHVIAIHAAMKPIGVARKPALLDKA